MNVQLVLDAHGQYTNLDVVSGRVVLHVSNNTTISHITVKLEGESRTRLLAPPRPNVREHPRPLLEIHKLLYRIAKVFPPEDGQAVPGTRPSYILNPSTYTYPFSFKVSLKIALPKPQERSSPLRPRLIEP
jgi:hypothetical protein